ncbi:MAG: hypothetical protein ACTSVA_07460 [Candidatus Njordarchaeales archaeon]
MNFEERKKAILDAVQELTKRSKVGGYLIITEKSTNKYVQLSVISGEEKVLIEVPEAQLSEEEVSKINDILREIPSEEEFIGLQKRVDLETAIRLIDRIFREGLGLPEHYDISVEIS